MSTSTQQSPTRRSELEEATTVFLAERGHLFAIAYRIVGEVAASEDVVQEAWLRWQRTDRGAIDNAAAFLTTATTHLAINVIQSARHRHERPTGAPLVAFADRSQDPAQQAELAAAVEQALGLLMARLTPAARAVYLLRNGFGYPYRDIARMLRTSVPNARQLARRAQRDLAGGRRRPVDPGLHRRLVQAFLTAARTGDLAELERLLAHGDCHAAASGAVVEHDPSPGRPSNRLCTSCARP